MPRSTRSCGRSYFASTLILVQLPLCANLHKLIRTEAVRRSVERKGREDRTDDVKIGRGGIRELEFIAQTFQIVRGGREPKLRSKSTLETLTALSELGVLPAATCERLASSYVFLRNFEHALQYVDDAQTHQVPHDDGKRVIAWHGCSAPASGDSDDCRVSSCAGARSGSFRRCICRTGCWTRTRFHSLL